MDLRERIVAALDAGESMVSVALRFGVCERTVRRYRDRAKVGALAPLPLPGKAPRLLQEQEESFVLMVQERSDWTIEKLSAQWQERTGVWLPSSTLHDHLKRLGGRYKKRAALPVSVTTQPVPSSKSR
jgi:putative transposase